jgi:peptidoglycan/xylan/chitin deacetylase (PgdA/CDA1 family)
MVASHRHTQGAIQLTFDDGPGPSTDALLDVLRDARCRATFFVLGAHATRHPDVLVRMLREGHAVGNHTGSHAREGGLSDAELVCEIDATDRLIRDAYANAGVIPPDVIPLRLPYGTHAHDPRLRVLARLGRSHVGWTALFEDWVMPTPAPEVLAARMHAHVVAQRARGDDVVMCLHDASPRGEARDATVAAVRLWLSTHDGAQRARQGPRKPMPGPGDHDPRRAASRWIST